MYEFTLNTKPFNIGDHNYKVEVAKDIYLSIKYNIFVSNYKELHIKVIFSDSVCELSVNICSIKRLLIIRCVKRICYVMLC